MGIPKYFSYLLENHSSIITSTCNSFDLVLMDCNSVIYDTISKHPLIQDNNEIITLVISQLRSYIERFTTEDNKNVVFYMAFDGMACRAKIEQQRSRRFKSYFIESSLPSKKNKTSFPTIHISPFTDFMNLLNKRLYTELAKKSVIISGADIAGEGEQKLFSYLRSLHTEHLRVGIYGLDADLFMLSLLHSFSVKSIHVCREQPEFGISATNYPANTLLYIDIQKFASLLCFEMVGQSDATISLISDYCVLCFLLGNDFLPSIACLQLRTNGMIYLLETYRKCIDSNADFRITIGSIINKHNLSIYLQHIATNEEKWIQEETILRDEIMEKCMKNTYKKTATLQRSKKTIENWIDDVPILFREKEQFICPSEPYWQRRYYDALFDTVKDDIVTKYVEGLFFVYTYYITGNASEWYYPYLSAPLMEDICVSKMDEYVHNNKETSICEKTLLPYIIPEPQLQIVLRDSDNYSNGNTKYISEFSWSYQRYFWESHAHFV